VVERNSNTPGNDPTEDVAPEELVELMTSLYEKSPEFRELMQESAPTAASLLEEDITARNLRNGLAGLLGVVTGTLMVLLGEGWVVWLGVGTSIIGAGSCLVIVWRHARARRGSRRR